MLSINQSINQSQFLRTFNDIEEIKFTRRIFERLILNEMYEGNFMNLCYDILKNSIYYNDYIIDSEEHDYREFEIGIRSVKKLFEMSTCFIDLFESRDFLFQNYYDDLAEFIKYTADFQHMLVNYLSQLLEDNFEYNAILVDKLKHEVYYTNINRIGHDLQQINFYFNLASELNRCPASETRELRKENGLVKENGRHLNIGDAIEELNSMINGKK